MAITIKASFIRYDESGNVAQNIFVPLKSIQRKLKPDSMPYLEFLIKRQLLECQQNSEDLSQCGSGWILHSLMNIQVDVVLINPLCKV